MSEKVSLTFEQFDETDDNTFSYQGPINLYKTVATFDELIAIPDETGFPMPELNDDNEFDQATLPNIVVYVKNVTGFIDSKRYRGAYFRYEYVPGTWQEIMLGTHSHENKDIIDKITSGNIGTWINLTDYPSVIYGHAGTLADRPQALTENIGDFYLEVGAEILYTITIDMDDPSPATYWKEVQKNTNTLFLNTIDVGTIELPEHISIYNLYKGRRVIEENIPVMYWDIITIINGTTLPLSPNIKDVFYKTNTEELYIFSGAGAGDRKMLVLEVTDPDNSDLTYSYDVAWTEMPESMPIVPEDAEETLYLGLDSAKNPVWKNSFLPSQVFQIKTVIMVPHDTVLEQLGHGEWAAGNSISIADVSYDPELDEALVMDGNFFLHNRDITYNETLRVLTVTANEDADGILDGTDFFDSGSVITVIIIRNGAAAVLDTLAADYVTKADAINLLSGGSINLNQYATKTDLQSRALHDHYHSGYSRTEHNHDNRYADFHHTHANYLTRRKVLELIEDTVTMNSDILNILQSFSDYLDDPATNAAVASVLADLVSQTDLDEVKSDIELINTTVANLADYVDNRRIPTDQIDTEYIDDYSQPKDLTQVLQEIKDSINSELHVIDSTNLFLDSDIEVQLGTDNIGEYDSGETVAQGTTLQLILETMLRKRIVPEIIDPELNIVYDIESYPEIGSDVNINVATEYIMHDAGSLTTYVLTIGNITLVTSSAADNYNDTVQIEDVPLTLSTYATYAQGSLVSDNFGDEVGRIQAGTINNDILTITPVRALFYGGLTTAQETFVSDDIRSLYKTTDSNYDNIDLDLTVPIGTGTIVFALPASDGNLINIFYTEQGHADVLTEFSMTTGNIEGANNTATAVYNIYYFKLPFPSTTVMHLTFVK